MKKNNFKNFLNFFLTCIPTLLSFSFLQSCKSKQDVVFNKFQFDQNFNVSQIIDRQDLIKPCDTDNFFYSNSKIASLENDKSMVDDVYLEDTNYLQGFFSDIVNYYLDLFKNNGSYNATLYNYIVDAQLQNISFILDVKFIDLGIENVYKISNYHLSFITPSKKDTESSRIYVSWNLILSPNLALPNYLSYFAKYEFSNFIDIFSKSYVSIFNDEYSYLNVPNISVFDSDNFTIAHSNFLSVFMQKQNMQNKIKLIPLFFVDAVDTFDQNRVKLNQNVPPVPTVSVEEYLRGWLTLLDYQSKVYSILNVNSFLTNINTIRINTTEKTFSDKEKLFLISANINFGDQTLIPEENDFSFLLTLIDGFCFSTNTSADYVDYYNEYQTTHEFLHSTILFTSL